MNDMSIHEPLTEKQLADELRLIKTGSCHISIGGILMRLNTSTVVPDPDRANEFTAVAILAGDAVGRYGLELDLDIKVVGGTLAFLPTSILSRAVPLIKEGQHVLNQVAKFIQHEKQKIEAPVITVESGPDTPRL